MVVAGLEVSTSAAKCILFSQDGGIIREMSIPFPPHISDTVSQEANGMVETAIQALAQAVRGYSGRVTAIGLGGTWHSLLWLDDDYRPLGRIRTWADMDAAPTVKELREREGFARWFYGKTGCMVHATYPIWKRAHQLRTMPMTSAAFCSSQVEYLFQSLTGERSVSLNMASGTGLLNIKSLDWDDELLELAELRRDQLGKLVEFDTWAPLSKNIADRVGLPSGLPVTVGGADGALTQIGLGGWTKGVVSLSVGTSGAVRKAVDGPALPEDPALWCYYLTDKQWLTGAATHAGSNLLRVLDWLGRRDDAVMLETEAAAIPAEEVPFFLPFLYGERCPGWMEGRSGGFVGLRSEHTPAHLYAAVLEGILFNLYQCYGYLEHSSDSLRATGGILNSPFGLQMAADLFGRDLLAGAYIHDSVVGAAVMALKAIGALKSLDEFKPDYSRRIIANPERHRIYQRRFQHYLELYSAAGEE